MMNDSYAGLIQAGPSFMQAIGSLFVDIFWGRRLSGDNLADDSRTKQAKSERQ